MTATELLFDGFALVSLNEVAASSGLSAAEIDELIELGVLAPRAVDAPQPMFVVQCIEIARTARRLRIDFDLPLAGVALVLAYQQRVRELQERLHRLECEFPGRTRS